MKTIILAGGYGTRISEETHLRPKPMVEIGGRPILWHIMKLYSAYGLNEFIICCGYKGYVIKEYFANYFLHMSDVTFHMQSNTMEVHQRNVEPWKVTLIDTGENTQTGGRLKRAAQYVQEDPAFCFTYGDGISDINISKLVDFHRAHGKLATVTAIQNPGRYGVLDRVGNQVINFVEKPKFQEGHINGGFFVLSSKCFQFIKDDDTAWEASPLMEIAKTGQLMSYDHDGFWHSMDTLRDKNYLEELWSAGRAPWKSWP